jgi:hypothetical protein
MSILLFHVFFEDNDSGIGFYIGTYYEREEAIKSANYIWDLFQKYNFDSDSKEIIEAAKFWISYKTYPDTEYAIFHNVVFSTSSGINTCSVFKSNDMVFINKYIEFRGANQPELFPIQPYEKCVMNKYKEKNIIARRKALRRGKKLREYKNIIVINGLCDILSKIHDISDIVKMFFKEEIEVTEVFFNDIEFTDDILIRINNTSMTKEIINFDNYFQYDIDLKAHCYDEVENVLYCTVIDIGGFQR